MLHVVEVLKKKKEKKSWGLGTSQYLSWGGGEGDGRGFEGGIKEFSGGTEGGSNVTNRV